VVFLVMIHTSPIAHFVSFALKIDVQTLTILRPPGSDISQKITLHLHFMPQSQTHLGKALLFNFFDNSPPSTQTENRSRLASFAILILESHPSLIHLEKRKSVR
jgi:hypothetical protein